MVICPKCMMELPNKGAFSTHICGSDSKKKVDAYNATNKEQAKIIEDQKKVIAKLEAELGKKKAPKAPVKATDGSKD